MSKLFENILKPNSFSGEKMFSLSYIPFTSTLAKSGAHTIFQKAIWLRYILRNASVLTLSLIVNLSLFAQSKEDDKNQIIEERIEYLSESDEESDADYTTIFDQLSHYFDKPLNLNRVSLDELESLGLLSSIQINNLLLHIEKNGKLMTLEELQTIAGFDAATIKRVLPFVRLSTDVNTAQLSFNELLKNGDNQLVLRAEKVLEQKKGYSPITDSALAASPNSRYLVNDLRIFSRYRYKYGNHVSIGITAEKDPGEEFFTGTQKNGFDFYSGHIFLRNRGKFKQIAIGDYQAQFGQGLTYWSGRAFGKGADIQMIKRTGLGLKPYSSVDETLFLRGGGFTFEVGKIETTVFYSYNKIDGNVIQQDTTGLQQAEIEAINQEGLSISSLQQTGFHRTTNELEDKDAITQQQMGSHLAYKTRSLNVGLTGIYSSIDANFNPNLQPYSQFRNAESEQAKIGVDYNWIYRNFNFFGEATKSINAGNAFVSGALITLDPRLTLAVLYRKFDRDFQPISSVAISEGSVNENETGLYTGIVTKISKSFTLSGYYDQFTFGWLKSGVDAPSKGHQFIAQLNFKPSKKMEMYVRVRERIKEKNTKMDTDAIDYLVEEKQTNYRFNYTYQITEAFPLKSRVELSNYDLSESPFETGYLIYQDIVFKAKSTPLSFSFRYAIFDTKSFNSRIYAYENDVLYSFSIPAYSNRGTRTYLTARYQFRKGIDLWIRYAITYYENLDVISSGLEEIQGNHKSDVKIQVRYSF